MILHWIVFLLWIIPVVDILFILHQGYCFRCHEDLICRATNVCNVAGHCVGFLSWSHSCSRWRQRTLHSSQICHSLRYHTHWCKLISETCCSYMWRSVTVCVHARRWWWPFPDGQRDGGDETDSWGVWQTHNSSAASTGHGKTNIFSFLVV